MWKISKNLDLNCIKSKDMILLKNLLKIPRKSGFMSYRDTALPRCVYMTNPSFLVFNSNLNTDTCK